jgi:hypothetical protein
MYSDMQIKAAKENAAINGLSADDDLANEFLEWYCSGQFGYRPIEEVKAFWKKKKDEVANSSDRSDNSPPL